MSKAVKFINWTNEDFTWKWGGEPTTIKARESIWMQDWKAEHFAKHLIDRELMKKNLPTDHHSRNELFNKCVSESGIEVLSDESLETELLNKNIIEEPKKKMGRPKKVEPEINPAFTE